MRATVCEWPDQRVGLDPAWQRLCEHVRANSSEIVVLPEMPFAPWLTHTSSFDEALWQSAVAAHDAWERRFGELGGAAVLGTRPVNFGSLRYNVAFVWDAVHGTRSGHAQSYLDERRAAPAQGWYQPAAMEFTPIELGALHVGFLIEAELWALEQARAYGLEGVELLVTPRRTPTDLQGLWLAAGRVAAVLAGAYGLSSNQVAVGDAAGAPGWIIDPDGKVLGLTSASEPCITREVDLAQADRAKHTYPRSLFAARERASVPWTAPGATVSPPFS